MNQEEFLAPNRPKCANRFASQKFNPPSMLHRNNAKKTPIFILQVQYAPGKQGKICIYENEEPELAVHKFAQSVHINREKEQIIMQIMKEQYNQYLKNLKQGQQKPKVKTQFNC